MIAWITNLFGAIGKLIAYGIAAFLICLLVCALLSAYEEEANIAILILVIGFTLSAEKTADTVFAYADYSKAAIWAFVKDQGLLFLTFIGIALMFSLVGMMGSEIKQMAYNAIAEISVSSFLYIFLIPGLIIYRMVKTTKAAGFLASLPAAGIGLLIYLVYLLVWLIVMFIMIAIGECLTGDLSFYIPTDSRTEEEKRRDRLMDPFNGAAEDRHFSYIPRDDNGNGIDDESEPYWNHRW